MFNNNQKPNVDTTDTVIGSETKVEGIIKSESSLRIDGKVNGEVHCDGDLIIGENGLVESSISARNLTLAGTANGQIKIDGKLHILSTGSLSGNAEMNALVIDEGGVFDGESKMKGQQPNPKSEKKKKQSSKELKA